MSRQEGKSAMEEMLASIREAIHEETAHQAVGLHAPLRVRAAHEAPVMQPDNDQAEEGGEPPFLKPLSDDLPETAWGDPVDHGQGQSVTTTGHPPLAASGSTDGADVRDDIGNAPFAPRNNPEGKVLRSVGGIMSGTGTSSSMAREAPAAESRAGGDAMFDASSADDSWWPEEEIQRVAEPEDAADQASATSLANNAEPLISPRTGELAARAFDMLRQELTLPEDLHAMTEEMLRPMLREWLDANLPELVERLVREEIARIAHGAPSRRMR